MRIQLGEAGKCKVLRLSRAEAGGWPVTRRRNVVQVFVREVMPQSPVTSTVLQFAVHEEGLDLTLPPNWSLNDPHVVVRRSAVVGARARSPASI